MVINDQYEFVFVHIPKCAGTWIRHDAKIYGNSWYNPLSGTIHPKLGRFNYTHVPLFTLKEFFKDEYEKLNSYWTFTVIRDPYKRFQSSISQRLKSHCGTPIQDLTEKEIIQEVDKTIKFLINNSSKNTQLPAEYIHFQRQVDYIYLDDNKIIDSVFTIDNIDGLLDQFYAHIGCEVPSIDNNKRSNKSIVFKNDILRRTIDVARPFTQVVINRMSSELKEKLRSMVYISSGKRYENIFQSNTVQDFIKDYYKDDIKLLELQQLEESKNANSKI